LSQRLAVDELHRVIEDASILTDLEDPRDVLVVDLRRDPRLVAEHVAELAIVLVRREDGLQGDQPLEPVLARDARGPDRAHAALRGRSAERRVGNATA